MFLAVYYIETVTGAWALGNGVSEEGVGVTG